MTCAACVRRIERALSKANGVLTAQVNLATEEAVVEYVAELITPQKLLDTIRVAGYSATVKTSVFSSQEDDDVAIRRSLSAALVLTIPLLVVEMTMLLPSLHMAVMQLLDEQRWCILASILASAVQFWPGLRFYRHGLASLRALAPDMNALVMIGTSAAYSYSLVATYLPTILPEGTAQVYYETSATIITLVLLGKYIEAKSKRKTAESLYALITLQPVFATVIKGTQAIEIHIEKLSVGDTVLVKPGERIPADGIIVDGSSYIDESMLTGEATPVYKGVGDKVIAGTINQAGSFKFSITATGEATVLAGIIKTVAEAQASRPPIQQLADKVVAYFVPIVTVIAAITFLFWLAYGTLPQAMLSAVSVLIVACPCAVGLATPVSVAIAILAAAKHGLLVRNAQALQLLSETDTIIFDKTGTLTEGKAKVSAVAVYTDMAKEELLRLVASLEAVSEHPLAKAITSLVSQELLPVEKHEVTPGQGIAGYVGGHYLQVGSKRYLQANGVQLHTNDEGSSVYVAIDGQFAAAIQITDPLKSSACIAMNKLRSLGKRIVIVSGDSRKSTEAVASQLNVTEVYAETLPLEKADIVRRLRKNRQIVFVGDGINDAPALAAADVGIAIGTGTDIAVETASVVLVRDNLCGVTSAITLSIETMKNVRQNLFWAMAYNAVLIPVAAGVFHTLGITLSPILAAAAMSLSSLSVLTNALRLRAKLHKSISY